jgi:cytochrome c oxidase subunit I
VKLPAGLTWEQRPSCRCTGRGCSAAVFVFFLDIVVSLRRGERAGEDPWDVWTLEWATGSSPPPYNFETVPIVASRRPLWDLKHPDDPDGPHE